MSMTRIAKMNSSRYLSIKLLAVYCVCLLLLTGCDGVKFKPVHGDPPAKKAQPRIVVVNTPKTNSTGDKSKKQRTSKSRSGNQKDDGDQDCWNSDR